MNQAFQIEILKKGLALSQRVSPELTGAWAGRLFLTPQRHKPPKWEQDILKTADECRIVSGNRVWAWGDGPNVLLVHGWSGRGSQMGRFVGPIVDAGYRAIVFDGPAHGSSRKKRTNILDFSNAVLGIEEYFGPIYGIIGHSFGGAVSVLSIHRGIMAQKLVLIAAPADLTQIFDSFSSMFNLSVQSKSEFKKFVEEDVKIPASEVSPVNLAPDIYNPTLIVHDPKDQQVPFAHAKLAAQKLQNARLLPVEGAGHFRILKNQDVIDAVVKFL